jgi:hypothetical protein
LASDLARQLAATLKETAPGQQKSNLECICDALNDRAADGNMKAIELTLLFLIDPKQRSSISAMSLEEQSRLYRSSLEAEKQMEIYDEDELE